MSRSNPRGESVNECMSACLYVYENATGMRKLLIVFSLPTHSHTACNKLFKLDVTLAPPSAQKQDQIINKLDHCLTYYSVHHACSNKTVFGKASASASVQS